MTGMHSQIARSINGNGGPTCAPPIDHSSINRVAADKRSQSSRVKSDEQFMLKTTTLTPHGICSRISHHGVCTPQQEPIFTHVYMVLIIPYQDFFCLSFLSLPNVRSLQFAKVKTAMTTASTLAKTYRPQKRITDEVSRHVV